MLKRLFFSLVLLLIGNMAHADPLDSWSTWVAAQPSTARQVPPTALVARGIGTDTYYVMEVDETTGALPVDLSGGTISIDYSGPTGSPVPADAAFVGGTDGTNLRGIKTDSGGELQIDVLSSALPSGAATAAKQPALGTAGTASADVITVQGIASMTPLQIADNGGSITVDGTVAATQSGTWNITNISGTVSLPTGAATESTLSTLNGKFNANYGAASGAVRTASQIGNATAVADFDAGAVSAQTLRVSGASRTYSDSVNKDYSGGSVTTAAWTQLIASTAAAINLVCITDTSGQVMELGTGGAGVESRVFLIAQGWSGCIPLRIAASTRVAVKAVTATASTGYLTISGMN